MFLMEIYWALFGNFSHGDGVINVPENVSDISYRQITPNGSEGSEYVNYLKTHKFSNVKVEMTYYESVTSIVYYHRDLEFSLEEH